MRNLRDLIPKCISKIMITDSINKLQEEVNRGINNSSDVVNCLEEPEHIRLERDTLNKKIKVLRKALKRLSAHGLIEVTQVGGDDSLSDSDDDDDDEDEYY